MGAKKPGDAEKGEKLFFECSRPLSLHRQEKAVGFVWVGSGEKRAALAQHSKPGASSAAGPCQGADVYCSVQRCP